MNTCGQCKHWVETEPPPLPPGALLIDPNAVKVTPGECREGPPNVYGIGIPTGAPGQLAVSERTTYPKPTAEFPACGRFLERKAA